MPPLINSLHNFFKLLTALSNHSSASIQHTYLSKEIIHSSNYLHSSNLMATRKRIE